MLEEDDVIALTVMIETEKISGQLRGATASSIVARRSNQKSRMRVPKHSPINHSSARWCGRTRLPICMPCSTSKFDETAWHECPLKNYPVLGYSHDILPEAKLELLNTDQSIFERLQAEKDAGVKLVITANFEIMARPI